MKLNAEVLTKLNSAKMSFQLKSAAPWMYSGGFLKAAEETRGVYIVTGVRTDGLEKHASSIREHRSALGNESLCMWDWTFMHFCISKIHSLRWVLPNEHLLFAVAYLILIMSRQGPENIPYTSYQL